MQTATKEQCVMFVGEVFGQLGDLRLQRQYFFAPAGQVTQFMQELLFASALSRCVPWPAPASAGTERQVAW